jgi:DNA-binding Lrp family transcriptional regulator
MKPQDIVVLLKLIGQAPAWTFEGIGRELGLSSSAVHRSLDRAANAGLYKPSQRKVDRRALTEFLVHGARYAFPPVRGGEARGTPTAWAAHPLSKELSASGENPPVWPDPFGEVRGIALEPLHPSVPEAARRDRNLGQLLALLDAVRIGGARERSLAAKHLKRLLRGATGE